MRGAEKSQAGFSLVELTVTIVVFAVVSISLFGLFTSLMRSTVIARRQAIATTLATNRMELIKSLPYDSLAVAGGSIYATSYLPATNDTTLNGVTYRATTSINFVDDAFDGCASYPNPALKARYCRNQPAPTSAPTVDTNPQDYKVVHVTVTDKRVGTTLAQTDTQIAARVSETASTTGALFVTVLDNNGNAVSGANVNVANTTITPVANLNDSSDGSGTSVFYGLKPDSGADYIITATKSGYSTLQTIGVSGTLQPTYPTQKVLTQQSSFVTLTLKPQGTNSLAIETTGVNGVALANVKVAVKGGYKKYVGTTDTSYYYDNTSPSDTRPVSDAGGLAAITNLVPGRYIFCGDTGTSGCTVGATTYYLAAAVPYGGTNALNPITVPTYAASDPVPTYYMQSGVQYLQKVRLMLTTSSSFPRVSGLTPSSASKSDAGIGNFAFQVSGANLPCTAVASSCGTTVTIKQGTNNFVATCTGTSAGVQLTCSANLSAAVLGNTSLVVTSGGQTLTVPGDPLIGGIILVP